MPDRAGNMPALPIRRRSVRAIFALIVVLFAFSSYASEVIPPKPDRYFNDYAGVVSKEASQSFKQQLEQYDRETSDHIEETDFPEKQSHSDIDDYTQSETKECRVGQKYHRNDKEPD